MDRHEGHGSLRGAVARIFKFRYAAVHDIPEVMIEKIADVLFQIGRVQDLNMMEIFKFDNELGEYRQISGRALVSGGCSEFQIT